MSLLKRSLLLFFLFNYCSAFSQIVNIESLRASQDSNGLHGMESLNLDYTRNTKELLRLTNNLSIQYKRNRNTWLFLNTIDVSLANKEILDQNAFFHLRYNYKINKWLTYEALAQYQINTPLRIRNRVLTGFGPRFTILEKPTNKLYIGLIALYEYDEEAENDLVHRNGRLSTYLSYHKEVKDKLLFSFVAYYQPRMDFIADYRAALQGQLMFNIFKDLAFNSIINLSYDAFPVEDEDIPLLTLKWSNGITYNF